MTTRSVLLCATMSFLLIACGSSKQTSTEPPAPRVPAKFDFSPLSRTPAGSTGITIAIVKPTYVGQNPEYFRPPFNEMASSMSNDFEELLTAKGFTIRGPFGSRDEMVFNDKENSNFVMQIAIELKPNYNRMRHTIKNEPSFGELLINSKAPTTYTYRTSGEITLAGDLVINARSSTYGELIWKKNIALEPSSFTYVGSVTWASDSPSMADELKKDNVVYNTLSRELEKLYQKALTLAWQQIDPEEMKSVAAQAKKADKK